MLHSHTALLQVSTAQSQHGEEREKEGVLVCDLVSISRLGIPGLTAVKVSIVCVGVYLEVCTLCFRERRVC